MSKVSPRQKSRKVGRKNQGGANQGAEDTVGALPEGTGLRNPGAEILKITKNHKERRVPSIMAFRRESGRWNTDGPHGPSVRTVRTDRPYSTAQLRGGTP